MNRDDADIQYRVRALEEADRHLSDEVRSLQIKLDNSLLKLTNNVSNLTDAIKVLQESQERTTDLQHSMIVLQERASNMPEIQKELNNIRIEIATQNVVLKAVRFFSAAVTVAVIGGVISIFFGG